MFKTYEILQTGENIYTLLHFGKYEVGGLFSCFTVLYSRWKYSSVGVSVGELHFQFQSRLETLFSERGLVHYRELDKKAAVRRIVRTQNVRFRR